MYVCWEMRLLLNLTVFISCPGRMVYHQRRKTTPLVCQLRAQYIVYQVFVVGFHSVRIDSALSWLCPFHRPVKISALNSVLR